MAIELTTATPSEISGIRDSLKVDQTKINLASRVLTNDTRVLKDTVVLNNWQTTPKGDRYHPIPFTDPFTKVTANLSANYGMSYNIKSQFSFVNSNNNTIIHNNFDTDLYTNIDYVPPSTPLIPYKDGLRGKPGVNSIHSGFDLLSSDGGFIIGGYFHEFFGLKADGLRKLSYPGITPTSPAWPTSEIFKSKSLSYETSIKVIRQDNDGNIIIGGYFRQNVLNPIPGMTIDQDLSILKLNKNDGTVIPFPKIKFEGKAEVRTIEVASDGSIYVGGNWNEYRYNNNLVQNSSNFIKLSADGTIDNDFMTNYGSGIDGTYDNCGVESIVIEDTGSILIGGYFNGFKGDPSYYNFIRLQADGTVDPSLNIGTYGFISADGIDYNVKTIVKGLTGDLLIGGYFRSFGGYPCIGLGKILPNGFVSYKEADNFRPRDGGSGFTSVNDIALQDDGKIIAVGQFSNWKVDDASSAVNVNSIVRLNYDGSIDETFVRTVSGMTGFTARNASTIVHKVRVLPNQKILALGQFDFYQNKRAPGIAILNSDGTYDGGETEKFIQAQRINGINYLTNIYQGQLNIGGYGEGFGFKIEPYNNELCVISETYPTEFGVLDYSIITNYGGVKGGDGTISGSGS